MENNFITMAASAGHAVVYTIGPIFHQWLQEYCPLKRYADKPETFDALKDNIREAIGEIQLHTIDNVLKNWTDRLGYCMARRGSDLNEIIFHYY